jgi:hypothetical protein
VLNTARSEVSLINQDALSAHEFGLVSLFDKLAQPDRMHLQPGTQDGSHRNSNKVAFYFYASTLEQRDHIEARMRNVVASLGLQVVCCEEKDASSAARRHPGIAPLLQTQQAPIKYCLDIVPFNKASAVRYFSGYISALASEIAAERGVARPEIEVWACGDSGNDFPLMAEPNISRVVMVGGASAELIRRAEFLKDSGKRVYVEANPDRLGPASIATALLD